jgi:hypothetical protein
MWPHAVYTPSCLIHQPTEARGPRMGFDQGMACTTPSNIGWQPVLSTPCTQTCTDDHQTARAALGYINLHTRGGCSTQLQGGAKV